MTSVFLLKSEDGSSSAVKVYNLWIVLCLLGQSMLKDPTVRLGATGGNGFKANVEMPHLDKTYR